MNNHEHGAFTPSSATTLLKFAWLYCGKKKIMNIEWYDNFKNVENTTFMSTEKLKITDALKSLQNGINKETIELTSHLNYDSYCILISFFLMPISVLLLHLSV